jgi:hypothetical protein
MYVHFREREATPVLEEPGICPRCRGLGQAPGGTQTDPGPCETCDATGRVVYRERPAKAEKMTYLVCAAQDIVDVAHCPLERLAAQLLIDWPELTGDLGIWALKDGLCPEPRLVAVVRPDGTGKPAVTYL